MHKSIVLKLLLVPDHHTFSAMKEREITKTYKLRRINRVKQVRNNWSSMKIGGKSQFKMLENPYKTESWIVVRKQSNKNKEKKYCEIVSLKKKLINNKTIVPANFFNLISHTYHCVK